jgi:hypothetical protein
MLLACWLRMQMCIADITPVLTILRLTWLQYPVPATCSFCAVCVAGVLVQVLVRWSLSSCRKSRLKLQ